MHYVLPAILCLSALCAHAPSSRLATGPGTDATPASAAREPAPQHADPRLELFVLESTKGYPELAAAPGSARQVGVVAWRCDPFAGGVQLECETTFFAAQGEDSGTRVLHVEQLGPGGPRLVWRELGADSGRSLLAEWTEDGRGLRTVEWSGQETLRQTLDTGAGAVMPLYLIELVRSGQATGGSYLRFDPLARALEAVEIRTSYEPLDPAVAEGDALSADVPALRTVELTRADGTLALRCRFRGSDLLAFQWQEGPLAARRIDAREYAALAGRQPASAEDDRTTRE